MNTKYTIDYFIKKFEAIHHNSCCIGQFENEFGQKCAQGHCGLNYGNCEMVWRKPIIGLTEELHEAWHLVTLFDNYCVDNVAKVNNGKSIYRQAGAKDRVIAALYDIKAEQALEEAKRIIKSEETFILKTV